MSTSPLPSRPDPFLGRVLKETYHLDRKLDENGAGTVYVGTHLHRDRTVAVKTLHGLSRATPEVCAGFFHEARMLSRLDHPNIVDLLDFDFTPEGLPFLVMAYLEGCTLDAFVPEGGLPYRTVIDFMRQILAGMDAAHAAGIIHRDLSPFNLFVENPSGGPVLKVLNFGVAKAVNDSGAKSFGTAGFGHPSYMSPEHFRNFEGMDARADIYSLGAVLHYLLTGADPFPGTTFPAVMAKVLSGQLPAPIDFEALGKPEAAVLEPLIHKAMAVDPARRYASVSEMRQALREAVVPGRGAGTRPWQRPSLRAVATFALGASPLFLLTGGFIAWHLSQPAPPAFASSPRDRSALATFQTELRAAVQAKDAKALLALVDAEARSPLGPGPEGVSAAWHPERPDAPLWAALERITAEGLPGATDRFEIQDPQSPAVLRLSAFRTADGRWRIDALLAE